MVDLINMVGGKELSIEKKWKDAIIQGDAQSKVETSARYHVLILNYCLAYSVSVQHISL